MEESETDSALKTVSLALLIINVGISAAVAIGLLRSMRYYPKIFEDFELELPLLTRVMLSPWTLVALFVLVVMSISKELAIQNRRVALIINAIHLPFILMVWQFHCEALMLPLINLITSLS